MGTSTIVRRYWCAEASPPSTTRLLSVSHRRGDRIRTYGLLYLLQLGGAGAFLSRCSAKLSYTSVALLRRADVPSLGLAVDSLQSAGLVVGISSGLVAHVDGGPVLIGPLGGPLVCGCSRGVMCASTHGILHSESWHWSSGFRLPYTIPLSRLVCIIANTMTYVNRSCSNWSIPL